MGEIVGIGMVDGEQVERNWSMTNRAGVSTKEMGDGSRRDHLDDQFGHHNYTIIISLRKSAFVGNLAF